MSNTGTIDKLTDKWFGFILTDSWESVFFHASALWEGQDWYEAFNELEEWDKLTFNIIEGENGKPKATNVKVD